MTATADNTPRNPTDRVVGMSALGHVWTAPWQELSDVAAALVGCGHVSSLVADDGPGTRDKQPSQVAITLLGDAPELVLGAGAQCRDQINRQKYPHLTSLVRGAAVAWRRSRAAWAPTDPGS